MRGLRTAFRTNRGDFVLCGGRFKALAKTFFAGGGQQYTVSVVNPEDLIEAQKNPDQYRNLIVRVGGYSDYFVNLEKGLQDNVIARTFAELG